MYILFGWNGQVEVTDLNQNTNLDLLNNLLKYVNDKPPQKYIK